MLRTLWLASGVVLLLGGCVVVFTTNSAADFGWFAHTPLEDGVHLTGGAVILSRTQVLGLCVGLAGVVLLASGVGYLAGQRRRV